MKIKSLELINWKQHKELLVNFNAGITVISGKNKLGKTNIYSALTFICDGKDYYNNQISSDSIMHGKNSASVKLEFENKDTFERIIALNPNENMYLFNGAELKKKDFEAKLSETGFLNARMFINPLYFAKQEHWTKRAEILIDNFSKIEHKDILKINSDLKELVDIYVSKKLNHDVYLAKVRKDHKELKKQLDELNIRLKEAVNINQPENIEDLKAEFEDLEGKLKKQRIFHIGIRDAAIKDVKCGVCGSELPKDAEGKAKKEAMDLLGKTLDFINMQGKALRKRQDAIRLIIDSENTENKPENTRVAELEIEIKKVSANLDKKEYYLNMIEEYERIKKELAEKQINEQFKTVQFRFFETQKNGEIKQACTPINKEGTAEKYWSTGESALIGIEICCKLQEVFSLNLPILIDNSESISENIETERQIILFEMDKNTKKITIK
ncbi:MAG TPA: AAA family ATPase [Bacteroidales bacterium]|nr:AAA family ATPase [Bacteroidales bacterium]